MVDRIEKLERDLTTAIREILALRKGVKRLAVLVVVTAFVSPLVHELAAPIRRRLEPVAAADSKGGDR